MQPPHSGRGRIAVVAPAEVPQVQRDRFRNPEEKGENVPVT